MDTVARLNSTLAERYLVEREVGAGGMATVYLARDTRHNRRVALKVLRPDLGAVLGVDRFLAEIQVTANLQHPNLLPLFDSGEADGHLFYVMPFVEGESLRARLDREKQLPLDDALRIATAVASALDYAHRHGVIHRDLKPENILLHEGQPLIADFGIALAVSNAGGGRVTQTGISLGTPQYMSPEQATGDRVIDARTDIYSLGAVAYEMLVGEPPHIGNTAQAVIARVVTERPRSIRSTRTNVPEHVSAAIERALEKLPADRWATAQEFSDALTGKVLAFPTAARTTYTESAAPARPSWMSVLRHPVAIGAMVGTAALGSALTLAFAREKAARSLDDRTVRFELSIPPEHGSLSFAPGGTPVAVSPDGGTYVYRAATEDGEPHLYVRRANEQTGRRLPGTEAAVHPTFSPDGEWIAFSIRQQLWRVAVGGGTPVRVASMEPALGIAWARDRIIRGAVSGPLQVTSASGGQFANLTALDSMIGETSHRFPVALPDSEHVVFTSTTFRSEERQLAIASLETGNVTRLEVRAGAVLGYIAGMLIVHDGESTLLGIPFDLRKLRVAGAPIPLVDSVSAGITGIIRASLSTSGTLIFAIGTVTDQTATLVAIDLDGKERQVFTTQARFASPRYSPSGRHIVAEIGTDSLSSLWMLDLQAGTSSPLTRGTRGTRPSWSPDGRNIAFVSRLSGDQRVLMQMPSDGTARPSLILGKSDRGQPVEIVHSPDGQSILYRTGFRGRLGDALWYRRLDGDTTTFPVSADSGYVSRNGAFSPDGRWVAYASNESGTYQVYVRPFPGPGARHPVSVDGGDSPVWAPNGRTLYYVSGQSMEAADIRFTPEYAVTRRRLFAHNAAMQEWFRNYDLSPDGSHFLFVRLNASAQRRDARAIVVHNWGAELARRMKSSNSR